MRQPLSTACFLAMLITALLPTLAPAQNTDERPDVVVVTGRQPGPMPWKVSKGDHVLWIFANPGVVPTDLEWDSARLERALAQSQEFLPPPNLDLGVSLPRTDAARESAATLEEVLPPSVWQDYLALKMELFPDSRNVDAMEKLAPHIIGSSLLANLYGRVGLVDGSEVMRRIDRLVRAQRNLRSTAIVARPSRGERRQLRDLYSASMRGISQERGISCLENAIASVRDDVAILQQRAKAWAEGYVFELGYLQTSRERQDYCDFALVESAEKEIVVRLSNAMRTSWHEAVDVALERNSSTVAVMELSALVADAGSALAFELRQRGYTVEIPD